MFSPFSGLWAMPPEQEPDEAPPAPEGDDAPDASPKPEEATTKAEEATPKAGKAQQTSDEDVEYEMGFPELEDMKCGRTKLRRTSPVLPSQPSLTPSKREDSDKGSECEGEAKPAEEPEGPEEREESDGGSDCEGEAKTPEEPEGPEEREESDGGSDCEGEAKTPEELEEPEEHEEEEESRANDWVYTFSPINAELADKWSNLLALRHLQHGDQSYSQLLA